MLKNFICPDGQETPLDACFQKCRMSERCAPLSYLRMCGHQREWTGKPSTTQLIGCLREAYFKIKTDYSESPEESAFKVLGTRGHSLLEKNETDKGFYEIKFELFGITGIFDSVECEDGVWILVDAKTSGSYKVAKALGIVKNSMDIQILDEKGNLIYYKSGTKKGEPKTKKEYSFETRPETADKNDWELQLNFYRMGFEDAYKEIVGKMFNFCTVRDGGTHVAKGRGIDKNIYMIGCQKRDDNEIKDFFISQRNYFLDRIFKEKIPTINPACIWDGLKCQRFCSVCDQCRAVGDNGYLMES